MISAIIERLSMMLERMEHPVYGLQYDRGAWRIVDQRGNPLPSSENHPFVTAEAAERAMIKAGLPTDRYLAPYAGGGKNWHQFVCK